MLGLPLRDKHGVCQSPRITTNWVLTNMLNFIRCGGKNRDELGSNGLNLINLTLGPEKECKKQWHEMGVHSHEGRDSELIGAAGGLYDRRGDGLTTSVFHPYLCEIFYR